MTSQRRPPRNGSELRRRTVSEYELNSGAALALLDIACAAFDQALAAEKALRAEGLTITGQRGSRPHPCVAVAKDARLRMLYALKALNLDL